MDIVTNCLEVEEGSVEAFNSDVVAFFSNYGFIKKGILLIVDRHGLCIKITLILKHQRTLM